MAQLLKQSTAATVKLGPFVDDSDGKTAETALTISQADIRLSKNGGDFAQSNNTAGATHDENGYYDVPLDATDTGTLGRLRVSVSESGALPVWQDFMVVPANIYDSLVGGSDNLQVDTVQLSGTAQTARDVGAQLDAAVSSRSSHSAADVWAVGTRTLSSFGTLASDIWSNATRTLSAFSFSVTASSVTDKTGYSLSAAGIQAIWDALTSAFSVVGSIGKLIKDNINAAITSRSSHSAADVWAAGSRSLTDKAGFSLAASQTGVTIGTVNALGAQAKADVNAEVVDALGVDAIPELAQGQPPATPTVKQALMLLYMTLRNQLTATASEKAIRNDAGTVIAKKALSDNGTTYTESKMVTGP